MTRQHRIVALAFAVPSPSCSSVAAADTARPSHVARRRACNVGHGGGEIAVLRRRRRFDGIASRRDLHVPSSTFRLKGGDIQDDGDEKLRITLSPLAFMSIFAFLGGWSHAICNRMFDCYTSLMTGHFLNMSIELAERDWKQVLWRMSTICSYAGGAATARSIELKFERLKEKDAAANESTNQHFKMIAPIVFVLFIIADKLAKGKVTLLSFTYGLFYPSVSAALGGTITHLLTGHTTNVARLIGAKQMQHKGMKTSTCILCSVVCGAVFGTSVVELLGDEFPFFSVLGVLYATALLLLV